MGQKKKRRALGALENFSFRNLLFSSQRALKRKKHLMKSGKSPFMDNRAKVLSLSATIKPIQQLVSNAESAQKIWNILREVYQSTDCVRLERSILEFYSKDLVVGANVYARRLDTIQICCSRVGWRLGVALDAQLDCSFEPSPRSSILRLYSVKVSMGLGQMLFCEATVAPDPLFLGLTLTSSEVHLLGLASIITQHAEHGRSLPVTSCHCVRYESTSV